MKEANPSTPEVRHRIYVESSAVAHEVIRATDLHGSCAGLHEAYAVILEELDEFWDLVKLNPNKMTPEQREKWVKNLHTELTQTAAMCVKAIVHLNLDGAATKN